MRSFVAYMAVLCMLAFVQAAHGQQRSLTNLLTGVSPNNARVPQFSPSSALAQPNLISRSQPRFGFPRVLNFFRNVTSVLQLPARGANTIFPTGAGLNNFPRTTADLPTMRIR